MGEERITPGAGMQLPRLFPPAAPGPSSSHQVRHIRHLQWRQRHAPHRGELVMDLRRHLLPVVTACQQQHQRLRGRVITAIRAR
jgi:hypothetical protein